jgi:hypothetical protein
MIRRGHINISLSETDLIYMSDISRELARTNGGAGGFKPGAQYSKAGQQPFAQGGLRVLAIGSMVRRELAYAAV